MSSHEQEIFIGALELPEDSRAPFLAAACADDPALRSRVESLLRAAAGAGRFLDGAAEEVREGPGACIGPYRLVARLGEGGFGVVYQAEQETPVRRPVALKIIKLGMDTRAVIARFAAERQALALMEHPHIARVLDAGATATGRPYFVMELVSGTPLTTYCREHRLTVRARLELFLQVCRAIHHAHQRGVIHRDLKPSNVLVARDGERPVAKVIDFGIAKATREPLTEHTVLSRLHLFVGTPDYMSPEQLGLGETDVDTRSDIYSLGALLYELLTETPPLDTRTAPGYTELEGLIRRVEPRPPSQRLAALPAETQRAVATNHRTTPPRLRGELRGDLDQIILKCLEKDRTRRYETTDELARDIQRYLADEPVLARPATLRHRFAKFVRRHRRPVAAGAAAVVTVVALTGYYTHRLATERDRAQLSAHRAAQMSDMLKEMLGTMDPFQRGGGGDPLTGMFASVTERARREFAEDPGLRADIFLTVGRVYLRLGQSAAAQAALEEAWDAARAATGRAASRAQILNQLGVLWRERGEYARAADFFSQAIARQRQIPGLAPNDLAITLVELGRVCVSLENWREAEALFREALALRCRALGAVHYEVATSLGDVGLVLWQQGRLAEAEPVLLESLAMHRRTRPPEHPNIASALANVAGLRIDQGNLAEAEALLREAAVLARRTLGPRHWRTARIEAQLGVVRRWQGHFDEAAEILERTLGVLRESPGGDRLLATAFSVELAHVYLERGDAARAEPLLREALAMQLRVYPENGWRVAATRSLLGWARLRAGQLAEAETLLLAAQRVLPEMAGPAGRETRHTRELLAETYTALGQPEQAAHYASPGAR